jgi:uncharacterized protein YndB with AHSA1/START domain
MNTDLIAQASITVDAPTEAVWAAFVDPALIKRHMFSTTVVSDWQEGGPIAWRGEWQGVRYEDKGIILELKPLKVLRYSHFSPLSGLSDVPENYHTVTIALTTEGTRTRVALTQDNNATEEARAHSEQTWQMMLELLKNLLEEQRGEGQGEPA